MFGYVTVYKPELKVKEYEAYKGVYCTLCKEMGKEYGILSRSLLSYDGAFYVLYKMGIANENVTAEKSRCTFNPCKKCARIICESDIYKLASTITVVLAYFKLADNLKDGKGIKKLLLYLLLPYFLFLKRKALKKHPDIFAEIEKGMAEQFEIEQEENTYNPLKNEKDYIETATMSINLSIGALSQTFENQSKNQFSPIIENVIYDGLNYQLERITKKNRGEKNE